MPSIPFRAAGAAALLLAACQPGAAGPGTRVEATWTGADTGKFAGAAHAAWCPVAARLELTAVRGDQGFGLVLYPDSVPVAGHYTGFDVGLDSVPPRPAAGAALRWYTEMRMEAFQSRRGTLDLSGADGRFDASFTMTMVALDRPDTIEMTGSARGISPGPCPVDSVPSGVPIQ